MTEKALNSLKDTRYMSLTNFAILFSGEKYQLTRK